ncbi:MAG: hypothetical protein ABIN66_01870 [candidate division WOR-3 bacterium]
MRGIYGACLIGLAWATACSPKEPGPLNLRYEVVDDGGAVQLNWDKIEGADYYRIEVDGDSVAGIKETTYTVSVPCKSISVSAVGTDSSASLSFELVPSLSVKIWSKRDPDTSHPWLVLFDTAGSAIPVGSKDKLGAAWYMNDDAADTARFYTNWSGEGGWNPQLGAWFALSSDSLSAIKIAPPPGSYFPDLPHDSRLTEGMIGIFWIDAGPDNAVGTGDHFGKMVITEYKSADPTYPSATADIYLQREPLLRWLVD